MTQVKTFAELTGKETFLSTLPVSDKKEDKLKIHAIKSTKSAIKEIKGRFEICGIYASKVDVRDRATKEMKEMTRVIIVDKDMKGYASTTDTMSNALSSLCEELWYPDFENPLAIEVIKGKSEKGEFFTIDLAM